MKTKNQKRFEAEVRQAERHQRTTNEQLALIAKRPGASRREVARLTGVTLPHGMKIEKRSL